MKLVNKGWVTATGLLGSQKVADMSDAEFYERYVHHVGIATDLVDTPDEFIQAIQGGGTVRLSGPIELDNQLNITKDTTLNLNNQAITAKQMGLVVESGAVLTLEGSGSLRAGTLNDGSNVAVAARSGGKVIIRDGRYSVGSDEKGLGNTTIYAQGGEVEIHGGEFSSDAMYDNRYWVLNAQNNTGGKITVYGGIFHNFDPGHPNTDDDASYLAEGYVSVEIKDGVYEVQKAVHSTYEMSSSLEGPLVAGTPVSMSASIRTTSVGNVGYQAVRFYFDTPERPEGSELKFVLMDTEGHPFEFINSGTWGPEGGFPMPAQYEATTPLQVTASMPGDYKVVTWLEDVTTGEKILEGETTATFTAAEASGDAPEEDAAASAAPTRANRKKKTPTSPAAPEE